MKKIVLSLTALFTALSLSGCGLLMPATETQNASATGGSWTTMLMYGGIIVVFFVAMYFMAIRPEKKREKEKKALLESMTVGDTVLTTAGFYGVVIDITNDTVIVEFGSNKNCRIPMQKASIIQLEHPEGYVPPEAPAEEKTEKKGFFSRFKKEK